VALAGLTAGQRGQDRVLHPPRVYGAFLQPGARFRYPAGGRGAAGRWKIPGMQPDYRRELRKFRVPEIPRHDDALVLVVDFELTVK